MYRQIDIDTITKNLDNIEDNAKTIALNKYEPMISEVRNVMKDIIDFIKQKKRIVYGGYAQNALINNKNKKDVFYREIDLADIEFYTPDPIGDMIDICDMLYRKNYKHVKGQEGVHEETYKVFVNFLNYCDISYMPNSIYNNCPTITLDGIIYAHPHFMLIDAYRVFTDLMTSHFRLKKTFTRTTRLIKYYPFNENTIYNKISYDNSINENKTLFSFIRKKIIHNSRLIVVGHYAFNQLMKIAKMPENYSIDYNFIQLVSSDYTRDVDIITNKLKSYNKMITRKSFHPFFQFLDKSTEWYLDDKMILRLYGPNDKCIVYRYSEKKKTYFGSYQLIFLYNLINYNIGIIRKNKFNEMVYGTMINRMIKARDTFLEKNNLSILDKSPFQEFTTDCFGEPKDVLRSSFLERDKKKDKGQKIIFSYKPTGKNGTKPTYHFTDSSGNVKM